MDTFKQIKVLMRYPDYILLKLTASSTVGHETGVGGVW